MRLNDKTIESAKSEAKPYKKSDGGGLYLLVQPNGAKYWRLNYRFAGKRKTLALGVYPDVTLADARDKRDAAKAILKSGNDPAEAKRNAKIEAARQKETEKLAATPPTFQLSISSNALTIQTKNNRLALTPEQTEAVRTFLIATPIEVNHEQAD